MHEFSWTIKNTSIAKLWPRVESWVKCRWHHRWFNELEDVNIKKQRITNLQIPLLLNMERQKSFRRGREDGGWRMKHEAQAVWSRVLLLQGDIQSLPQKNKYRVVFTWKIFADFFWLRKAFKTSTAKGLVSCSDKIDFKCTFVQSKLVLCTFVLSKLVLCTVELYSVVQ